MKIQILGTGCPKCRKLAENAQAAADELGLDCEIVKVTKIHEIVSFGTMLTPALAIDGKLKIIGKVASVDELKTLFSA